ncbi:hypothetical protein E2C01_007410 [Portunus trituberculatus]|uniref:Uncharacterized protein n=1 Tax=Portunus trituberculatus TaxID=210409 RepID=A0A5B7CYY7_PORTR|nr:hypothetical protein [Portunus trituberculatus]
MKWSGRGRGHGRRYEAYQIIDFFAARLLWVVVGVAGCGLEEAVTVWRTVHRGWRAGTASQHPTPLLGPRDPAVENPTADSDQG